jgi:hypothetical protein
MNGFTTRKLIYYTFVMLMGAAEELGLLYRGGQLLHVGGFVIQMCFCGMFCVSAFVKSRRIGGKMYPQMICLL